MTSNFYIPRSLIYQDRTLTEAELLRDQEIVVLLAEPGAGKSDLLDSIAGRFGVPRQRASIFREKSSVIPTNVLVLDALDEAARLDSSGLLSVLVKAQETGASRVILASRSSEWEESRSVFIRDCFGSEPLIARLEPFSDAEQEKLFCNYVPGEDFSDFKAALSKFDLQSLLGNPQFLKLFADAFVESGKRFNTKREIFDSAVRRLTHEANRAYPQGDRPSEKVITKWADEVFAKLLLSGADGVSISDNLDERHFPRLSSLVSENNNQAQYILDTRLLKPSTNEGQHEPVHRIVAEYCAARYLAKRIEDSADLLTLRKCLAIIAPNSVVRDELRGLLGWMAALGNRTLQEAAITLDPYAVLANGDPSQLLPSSRRKLLAQLSETAEEDPYFRRGDMWRTFSLSGFFSAEVLEDLRLQLVASDEHGHLRNLLLEILEGSDVIPMLVPELRALMLNSSNSLSTRLLAHRNLATVKLHDHKVDCEELIREGSHDAMRLSVEIFQKLGVEALGRDTLLTLFRRHAELYLKPNEGKYSNLSTYYVSRFIRELDLCHAEWLLDQLTEELGCTCGADEAYDCTCRHSISKVIGRLLDRYFEKKQGPFDPTRIWQWIKSLNFQNEAAPRDSESVQVLQTDHELRQNIQRYVLAGITNPDELRLIWRDAFGWGAHAGLRFQPKDTWAMVDLAFESDNPALWASFHAGYNPYRHEHGPDALRAHMRRQANQEPDFMEAWAKQEHTLRDRLRKYLLSDLRHRRRMRRHDRREDQIKAYNRQYLENNRVPIESGSDWRSLYFFAQRYLMAPEELSEQVGDPQIAENALCNCLPFIEPELPTLQRLAELQCESQFLHIETVLHAACLAIFRRFRSLAGVKLSTLAVLKTDLDLPYSEIDEDTRTRFEAEVDSRLFQKGADAERFAREYLEPQISNSNCKHTQLWWLRSKPEFSSLLGTLPLEWLRRFPETSLEALETLFQLVVEYCDQSTILELIHFHTRYVENSFFWPGGADNQDLGVRRSFWFVRSFFFERDCPEAIKDWLRTDPDTIFALERLHDSIYRGHSKGWPYLPAGKVFLLLDAFAEAWPKVHLPNSWGTHSPKEERAYRFLTDIVWTIRKDDPDNSLPVLDPIISDERLEDFHDAARDMKATALRAKALRDFKAPTPSQIVEFLDANQVATVEGLRALLVEVLEEFQREIDGSEFDPIEQFYSSHGNRVDEITASKRIANHIQMSLKALSIPVTIEHQLKNAKRCDITATQMLEGKRRLLVTEVKGQWNSELFSAATEQLHRRYAIHPDAEHQGIYLVLWFGADEDVAGRQNHSIFSPSQLQDKIVAQMPKELHGLIDVFVMDLSLK